MAINLFFGFKYCQILYLFFAFFYIFQKEFVYIFLIYNVLDTFLLIKQIIQWSSEPLMFKIAISLRFTDIIDKS